MISVTIKEISKDGRTLTSAHRTDDRHEAMQRAITKHYGAKCRLFRDNGLGGGADTHYGQIGYYVPSIAASTMVTGRVRIDIEA